MHGLPLFLLRSLVGEREGRREETDERIDERGSQSTAALPAIQALREFARGKRKSGVRLAVSALVRGQSGVGVSYEYRESPIWYLRVTE